MDPDSKEKTAFTTFAVQKDATLLSQRKTGTCMCGPLAENDTNVTQVLERLSRAKLCLKLHKCWFTLTEVVYLGHVVSAQGVQTEVYPTLDQSAATIANLIVRQIVSRHGVPSELLSDRGLAFLSGYSEEVQQLLGDKKLNTSAYHGLVECLMAMLAKTVNRGGKDWKTVNRRGKDWEQRLPYVLFA